MPAFVDDWEPVANLTNDLIDKLFGDRSYIFQALFTQLHEQGLQLITRCKKNMKNRLMPLIDKILLRKRAVVESINDQLKNISQIEHCGHRSLFNFVVNLLTGLVAYTYQEKKPSLDIRPKELPALPPAIF